MHKVWHVILDLVYEDPWQFFGPIAAVLLVALVALSTAGVWMGFTFFALVALSLALSLRRER